MHQLYKKPPQELALQKCEWQHWLAFSPEICLVFLTANQQSINIHAMIWTLFKRSCKCQVFMDRQSLTVLVSKYKSSETATKVLFWFWSCSGRWNEFGFVKNEGKWRYDSMEEMGSQNYVSNSEVWAFFGGFCLKYFASNLAVTSVWRVSISDVCSFSAPRRYWLSVW